MFKLVCPGGGFRIVVNDDIRVYIESECSDNPRIRQFWDAMLERMKMTALKEGEELRNGIWSFTAEGAPKLGVPTLQALFTHDEKTLTIINALVWRPGDEDPDEDE